MYTAGTVDGLHKLFPVIVRSFIHLLPVFMPPHPRSIHVAVLESSFKVFLSVFIKSKNFTCVRECLNLEIIEVLMFFQFFKCHAIWFDLGFNNELFRFGRRYAFFDRTRLLNCSFLTSIAYATIFSRTSRSSRSGVSSRFPL